MDIDQLLGENALDNEKIEFDSHEDDELLEFKQGMGYTVFCATIARFMPKNTAFLIESEAIAEMMEDLGFEVEEHKDVLTDLIVCHFYHPEDDTSDVVPQQMDDFLDSLNFNSEVERTQMEALLRAGNILKIKFSDQESDEEE